MEYGQEMDTRLKTKGKDIKPNATYGELRNSSEPMAWEKARSQAYWDYRRKWVEYPKRMFAGEFPLHLDIETTNVCNLKCTMCPRTIQIARKTYGEIGMMDLEFYRSLIDQGAEHGLCSIKLNYLGEPLIHRDVVEQIRYAKRKGIIEVMMNTNGTVLTEAMSQRILDAGIDSVYFSIDSPYREAYNSIRVGADLDDVVRKVVRFAELRDQGGYRHVQTRVSMVMMHDDPKELEDFREFWEGIVDAVGFSEYVDHDFGSTGTYSPDFVCAQPFQRMFIMWDGIVTPCCVDDKRGYILGDARKEPLKTIWHGEPYRKLREAMAAGRYIDIPICRDCYVPSAKLGG